MKAIIERGIKGKRPRGFKGCSSKKKLQKGGRLRSQTYVQKCPTHHFNNSLFKERPLPSPSSLSPQNLSSREERVKLLRKYLRKYGVAEEYIFEEEDLTEFKNIPKVTRCFAMLAKMVS